jgi:preprotein translocase subunit SecG
MTVFIIVIHVIVCIGLIGLVLIQRGRGSGLVESFQGVESMFGTKTNTFLTRTTTVLSIIFFITCLSLALISIRQSRSLMRDITPKKPVEAPATAVSPAPAQEEKAAVSTPSERPQDAPAEKPKE